MYERVKKIFIITIGTFITSIAISTCYLPNKTVSGGVSGLSVLLHYLIKIPPGMTIAALNAILLLVAWRVFGKKFVAKSVYGSLMLSLFVQIMSYSQPMTNNMMLSTIFGGVMYGTGIGIVLATGANTGGTDIFARLIQHKFPHMLIGKTLLLIDGLIILFSFAAFKNIEILMYGIMALTISSFMIDFIFNKMNVSKIAIVITEKGDEISRYLISTSPRGVTKISAIGAYEDNSKYALICVLKTREIAEFEDKILMIDVKSFIIYAESQFVVGNGFSVYK